MQACKTECTNKNAPPAPAPPTTPAVSLGITDHVWSIGELIDVALATQPQAPEMTAPDRRKRFQVIEGGRS